MHKIRDFVDAKKRFFGKNQWHEDRAAIIRKRTSPLIFKFSKKCYSKENPFIHILDSTNAKTRKGRFYYGVSKNREYGTDLLSGFISDLLPGILLVVMVTVVKE